MECKKCGGWIPEGAGICAFCGTEVDNYAQVMEENKERFGMEQCSKCGYIGASEAEKMISKKDWVILVLTFFCGLWPFYLVYLWIKKGNPSKRNRVCPVCGNVMKKSDSQNQQIETEDIDRMKNIVKSVVTNPEIKKSVKEIGKSVKELGDTMDINRY